MKWIFGALCLLVLSTSDGAKPCAVTRVLYVPVDTVTEPYGLRGETRAQYLDRRYGTGKWKTDKEQGVVTLALPHTAGAPFRVRITEPPGTALARAEVIVESRLDFLNEAERRMVIYGYREAAGYLLTPGTDAEIAVPGSLFKEPGALLVAVTLLGEAGRPLVAVTAASVDTATSCERRVYVKDRFTAIRLNRAENKGINP